MSSPLTPKQERFVAEYLANGLNATSAYIAAGYSEKGATAGASNLLSNAKVQAKVAEKLAKVANKLELTAEMVLAEIRKVAMFDPRNAFNKDGSPKQIHELDDDTAAAVAGLEVFDGQGDQKHAYGPTRRVKLADKLKALELLAKYFKMLTDKQEISGPDGKPVQHDVSLNVVFVDHE